MTTRIRFDPCLILFWLMGSVVIIITLLALLSLAIPELSDLSHLASVASESGVIEAILLTMVAALMAVIFLVIFWYTSCICPRTEYHRLKEIVENLVDIPLVLPHTVAGLMVYLLFMSRGTVGCPVKKRRDNLRGCISPVSLWR